MTDGKTIYGISQPLTNDKIKDYILNRLRIDTECFGAYTAINKAYAVIGLSVNVDNFHANQTVSREIVNDAIEQFVIEASHLNSLPEQMRQKILNYAWEKEHANGWHSVYALISELVEIFKP